MLFWVRVDCGACLVSSDFLEWRLWNFENGILCAGLLGWDSHGLALEVDERQWLEPELEILQTIRFHSLSHYKFVPGGFGRKYAICMIYHHCTDVWAKWLVGWVWLRNLYMYDIYTLCNFERETRENNWWLSKDIHIVSNKRNLSELIVWKHQVVKGASKRGEAVWTQLLKTWSGIVSSCYHVII